MDLYVDYRFTSHVYIDWFWTIFYEERTKGNQRYVCGLILLPITLIFMLGVIGKDVEVVGIIVGVQLVLIIGSIIPTEITLRKNFDKNSYYVDVY